MYNSASEDIKYVRPVSSSLLLTIILQKYARRVKLVVLLHLQLRGEWREAELCA